MPQILHQFPKTRRQAWWVIRSIAAYLERNESPQTAMDLYNAVVLLQDNAIRQTQRPETRDVVKAAQPEPVDTLIAFVQDIAQNGTDGDPESWKHEARALLTQKGIPWELGIWDRKDR